MYSCNHLTYWYADQRALCGLKSLRGNIQTYEKGRKERAGGGGLFNEIGKFQQKFVARTIIEEPFNLGKL